MVSPVTPRAVITDPGIGWRLNVDKPKLVIAIVARYEITLHEMQVDSQEACCLFVFDGLFRNMLVSLFFMLVSKLS